MAVDNTCLQTIHLVLLAAKIEKIPLTSKHFHIFFVPQFFIPIFAGKGLK